MSVPEQRLAALGLKLPPPVTPAGSYVPFVCTGRLVFIAGQLCFGADGAVSPRHIGRLGEELSADLGKEAAQLSALNVLAQAKLAAGDLDRIARCVRLAGFINAAPGYSQLSQIMNAASELIVDALGERGRHSRTTIGCVVPRNAAIEIEAVFEIDLASAIT